MRRLRSTLRWLMVSALCVGSATAVAQESAKTLYVQSQASRDPCDKVKKICLAAAMDKKYRRECSDDSAAIGSTNTAFLEQGYARLNTKSYDTAKMYANQICEVDPSVTSKKQQLLTAIKEAQAVVVAAVTPPAVQAPPPKPEAKVAVQQQPTAAQIPQQRAQAAATPSVQQPRVAQTRPPQAAAPPKPNPEEEKRKELAVLLDHAGKAADTNNLPDALKTYEQAQRLQPGNPDVAAGLAGVQAKINSRPEEQAKVLATAIRAFYSSNYTEAENSLVDYLGYTNPKYKGAADFYLGATRLYKSVLEASVRKPEDAVQLESVQSRFKAAREACYEPIPKYLSPLMARAWKVSAASATCSR